LDGDYILVIKKLDISLREYLQQNHSQLTWKERIKIIVDIIDSLEDIHSENAIHRDLHSGNILYYKHTNSWFISDFGFCGPANMPTECIYGNLSYIAPEVIANKKYTKASDIYSVGMLMWEISYGQPSYTNYDDDYELVMDIVNGMRPKVISGIPSKYKELMEQCWDADTTKRPDINTLSEKIGYINRLYYQNTLFSKSALDRFLKIFKKSDNLDKMEIISYYYASSRISISKIYHFENLPEPKNATEGMF
jgi:serine/threonine protein kinase